MFSLGTERPPLTTTTGTTTTTTRTEAFVAKESELEPITYRTPCNASLNYIQSRASSTSAQSTRASCLPRRPAWRTPSASSTRTTSLRSAPTSTVEEGGGDPSSARRRPRRGSPTSRARSSRRFRGADRERDMVIRHCKCANDITLNLFLQCLPPGSGITATAES